MAAIVFFVILAVIIAALFTVPSLQGLRTKIVGIIIAAGGGLVPLLSDLVPTLQTVDWTTILSKKEAAIIMAVLGVLVVLFRSLAKLVPAQE